MVKTTSNSHQIKRTGASFQERVLKKILNTFQKKFSFLNRNDIASCLMCKHGADIQLSNRFSKLLPATVSCRFGTVKHKTLYRDYSEAVKDAHKMATSRYITPILAVQANGTDVLFVISADDYLRLASDYAVLKQDNETTAPEIEELVA